MKSNDSTTTDVDDFIARYPADVQEVLQKIRGIIREAAPEAQEKINYGIPTFTLNGNLVHYSAFKDHIGFYPTPGAIEKFRKELSKYKGAKGSVQFPLDQPIPYELIRKITEFRVREQMAKAKKKK
jgi:uncharacterized protein YdhG (YjbR/CyaY superfamily)